MPAIVQKERDWLDKGNAPETHGQVNYLLTKLYHSYWSDYDSINNIAEEVECVIYQLLSTNKYTVDPTRCHQDLSHHVESIVSLASDNVRVGAIVGALRNSYTEFYRMKAADYEDTKYELNGKV